MINAFTHHGADNAEVIDAFPDMRKQVRDGNAALPAILEGPRRLHQRPGIGIGEGERTFEGQRLAVQAGERFLGIEGVDRRRPAVHEEKDDPLCFRLKMRLLGQQRAGELAAGRGALALLREQPEHTQMTEAAGGSA